MGFWDYFEVVMKLLGGMGAFLLGMHLLSEHLTRLAHGKLRTMLNKTSNNRFAGVGIGAGVTMIAQSSALTTVMVVGLVNAGIMTLFQGTAIIMGANIGTTITAWIVTLSSVSFSAIFLSLTAIGIFLVMFSKKEKVKMAGSAIAALGLIFVGLEMVSGSMGFIKDSEEIQKALEFISNPFLLILIGILITALVQSSSAVTAILITMAAQGIVIGGGGNAILYIIIGSNIGTCVTALISSIGANANAKRAAFIHFLFNFFGAIIFMIFLLCWRDFTAVVLEGMFPGTKGLPFQIAFFHTLFNVICTLIFLPFINLFVKVANFVVREPKKTEEEKPQTEIITDLDDRLLRSPSVALGHLYQETGKMFSYAMDTLGAAFGAFLVKDVSATEKVTEQNANLAVANKKTVEYLVRVSATALPLDDEKTVSALHYVLNDIMRIGELADNITKYTGHYVNDNLVFSDEFLGMIRGMYENIKKLYVVSLATYLYKDFSNLAEVDKLEDEIDKERRSIVAAHIQRLNEGKCQPENSSVFINLVGNLERAADHITFIAHSIEKE